MTDYEKKLIEQAVDAAVAFGTGIISGARFAIVDAGYYFSAKHEDYAIQYWCSLAKEELK